MPLAALGTIAGAASSAASAGGEIYSLGKLDSAENARPDQAVAAARAAADDLGLKPRPIKPEQEHPSKDSSITKLPFLDDKCAKVNVTVERRAARLVHVRINVGLFGSQETARLFLARLRAHLPAKSTPQPPATQSLGPT